MCGKNLNYIYVSSEIRTHISPKGVLERGRTKFKGKRQESANHSNDHRQRDNKQNECKRKPFDGPKDSKRDNYIPPSNS